jgi:DNA-binding NarL/FixJ family response regulator
MTETPVDRDAVVRELQDRHRSLDRFIFRIVKQESRLREHRGEALLRARAAGLTNGEIAHALHLTPQWVTSMLKDAEAIAAWRSRTDAAA